MTILAGYLFLSTLCGSLILWILLAEPADCVCGQCEERHHDTMNELSKLRPTGQLLLVLVIALVGLPAVCLALLGLVFELLNSDSGLYS